jgi:hypothetical protein
VGTLKGNMSLAEGIRNESFVNTWHARDRRETGPPPTALYHFLLRSQHESWGRGYKHARMWTNVLPFWKSYYPWESTKDVSTILSVIVNVHFV